MEHARRDGSTVRVPVTEPSQVGEARRVAAAMAAAAGLDEDARARVALVATEAATNIAKHGAQGELLVRTLATEPAGIEILALDRGQGIGDVARALHDGFSTAGTSGTGLGAIRRQADGFDIYSSPGAGTAIVARIWSRRARPAQRLAVAGVSIAKHREDRCGDAWSVVERERDTLVMVADGLGHGELAADAASEMVRIFRGQAARAPREILEVAHIALRSTRGAAVAIAQLGRDGVRYAGIGNIAGTIVEPAGTRSLVSLNGIVGHELRRVQEFEYRWDASGLLVMFSDGLTTQWRLDAYPGLAARDPALVAGVLYRDFARGRDDVTVVAARVAPAEGGS